MFIFNQTLPVPSHRIQSYGIDSAYLNKYPVVDSELWSMYTHLCFLSPEKLEAKICRDNFCCCSPYT
jgi:hypothetical protein